MRKTIKNNIFKNNLWNSEEAISENMKKTPPNSKKIIIINALNFILVFLLDIFYWVIVGGIIFILKK